MKCKLLTDILLFTSFHHIEFFIQELKCVSITKKNKANKQTEKKAIIFRPDKKE